MKAFDCKYKDFYREAYEFHKKYYNQQVYAPDRVDWDGAAHDLDSLSKKYRMLPFAAALLSEIFADLFTEPTDELSPWEQEALLSTDQKFLA